MASNDLVVVIPGITGSILSRDGEEIWSTKPATLLAALATLGRGIRELELPADIGDEQPNDGVEPTGLMPHMHFIPGLWTPIHGYDKLVGRLQNTCMRTRGQQPDRSSLNPVLFPYDWRLSNRYTARRLKQHVESALGRWRDSAPENRNAKIVFVCHSMGGLIARWYISKEGGAALTRKMITLGTPYRGAIKALTVLTAGPLPKLGRFGEHIHSVALSFPSLHQLLPSYACINQGAGGLQYLVDQTDSPLSRELRYDAASFYQVLEESESRDSDNAKRRHTIVGTKQPTDSSAVLRNGRYATSETLGIYELAGDGTVSAASLPKNVPLDDNSIRRVADKHGHLQCNTAALDEVESVLTSEPIVVKAASIEDLSVRSPEILSTTEDLVATIESSERRTVTITVRDERGHNIAEVQKVVRNGRLEYRTTPLEPGGYDLEVRDLADTPESGGVSSPFIVWPHRYAW